MRNFFIFCLFIAIPFLTSCKKDRYEVNISSISVNIDIKRLETDIFEINPTEIPSKVPFLKQKYGTFLQFFSDVINTGDINEPSFSDFLVRFCTDKQNNDVYKATMQLYPNTDKIKNGLTDAFRHYRYYFPNARIPSVYTCISGFNSSIFATGDSILGVGLDKYLGSGSKYYPMLGIYTYLSEKMTPDYIVSDCMFGFASTMWDFGSLRYKTDNVLAEVIHNGKLKYFEKCMIPSEKDEIIFGFSEQQMKFCRNNESQMWQYLVENDLLFKTEQLTIRKLVGEAPFTTFFTKESPGKAAAWLGFRIVESYMEKNPGVSLKDLMSDTNVQEILEKAKYNPN